MEILKVQPIMYNQHMQNHTRHQKNKTPEKFMNANGEKSQISDLQDIIERKKSGGALSIGEKKLVEMIEKANKSLLKPPTELRISVHEKTRQIIVKIVNAENREVIREIPSEKLLNDQVIRDIPPEKLLNAISVIWQISGLFVNEKA